MTRSNRYAGLFGAAAVLAGCGLVVAQPGEAPKQPAETTPAKPATPPATPPTTPTTPSTPTTPAPKAPATPPSESPDKTAEKEQLVYVQMKTSMGDIVLELDQTKAPISVENFMKYVDKGHYNGTIFHRVIPDFMVQCGGFGPNMTEKETMQSIKNEWKNGLKNKRGTVAMARRGNMADSATSQFFINLKDNDFLDQPRDGAGYAVFGKVATGMDVVDKIGAVQTGMKNGMGDVPVSPVTIEKVTKVSAEEAKGATPEKK